MLADHGLGFDDYKGLFPIAELRPEDERETAGVAQSSRSDLPLLIEDQLLSQEQHLRAQGCARAEHETGEVTLRANPVDITHECTLRGWPRLGEWLEREARNARRLRELALAEDAGDR
jgi:hypothetical protein